MGLEHISSTKKSTISYKTSIHANFMNVHQLSEHITFHLTASRRPTAILM